MARLVSAYQRLRFSYPFHAANRMYRRWRPNSQVNSNGNEITISSDSLEPQGTAEPTKESEKRPKRNWLRVLTGLSIFVVIVLGTNRFSCNSSLHLTRSSGEFRSILWVEKPTQKLRKQRLRIQ